VIGSICTECEQNQ